MKTIKVGDRVQVRLGTRVGVMEGWYSGTVYRLEPYSEHRTFYWVEFDHDARTILGIRLISVFNPKHIRLIETR